MILATCHRVTAPGDGRVAFSKILFFLKEEAA